MLKSPLRATLLVLLAAACHGPAQPPADPDFALLAEHAPSVVQLEARRGQAVVARSTAFFVGQHELLATFDALAPLADPADGTELRYVTDDGADFPIDGLLAASCREGLVVLTVEHAGVPLALVQHVSDEVRALGFQSDESWPSLVCARLLDRAHVSNERFGKPTRLELDVQVSTSALGGPVLTPSGDLVGVLVSVGAHSLAAPSAAVRELVAAARKNPPRPLRDFVAEHLVVHESPGQVVTPQADGRIVLSAAAALPHGKRVQFERKGLAYNIGYWTEREDFLTWELDLRAPARFVVRLVSSCPDSTAHTSVTLEAAASHLTFEVPATGSFLTFREATHGELSLPAGRSTLTLRPNAKAPIAVMDLDHFELVPISQDHHQSSASAPE